MTWGRIDAKKERNNRRRLGAIWRNTRGDILHRPKIEKKKKIIIITRKRNETDRKEVIRSI